MLLILYFMLEIMYTLRVQINSKNSITVTKINKHVFCLSKIKPHKVYPYRKLFLC